MKLTYSSFDLIVVNDKKTIAYRWWWRKTLLFGVSFSLGTTLFLGPLGSIQYWP